MQLSPCLFAYDAAAAAPVLYGFNLNGSWQKKTDFCPKCSIDDGKPPRDLTPKATSSKWNPDYTMAVALGSSVYLLGGVMDKDEEEEKMHHDVSPTRAVYYFDTKRPLEEVWIRGPDMINGRGMNGRAVVVEGKIYVFGGNDCEKAPRPWAEVLDPVKMKWKALPRPPRRIYLDEGFLCAPAVAYDGGPGEGKKIIVGEGKYVYDVNSEEWEQLSPKLQSDLNFSGNLAGVGSFLYWTDEGMLFALNMSSPEENYSAKIKGYPMPLYRDNWCNLDEPQLLHLGGNRFCLLKMKELRRDRTKVRLYRLRVSKRDGGFKAYIVGCQTHIFDQPLALERGLLLEGSLHGVKKENLTKKRKRILV